jgi:hypothetical protein
MLEDVVLDRDEPVVLKGDESPQSVPASYEPGVKSDRRDVTTRAPSHQENPAAKAAPVQPKTAQPQGSVKGRASFLRRRCRSWCDRRS